jgi:hypothetical protein
LSLIAQPAWRTVQRSCDSHSDLGLLDDIGRQPSLIVRPRGTLRASAVLPERRTGVTLGNKQLRADLLNAGAATRGA